MPIEVVT